MTKPAKKPDRLKKAKAKKAKTKLKQAEAKIAKGLDALPVDAQKPAPGSAAPASLLETVIELRPYTHRFQLVRLLCPRFNVSSATVDRAIKKAKEIAAERYGDKGQLLQDGLDFLGKIASSAYKEKEFHAARGAVMDQQKLVGNTRPDVVLIGSMDAPAEEQLKLADELRSKIDAARKRSPGK